MSSIDQRRLFPIALVGSTLVYLWVVVFWLGHRHWMGTGLILFNLLLSIVYNRLYSRGGREWGFSGRDFFPALRLAMFVTVPAMIIFFFVGLQLRSLAGRANPALDLLGLFLWALAQQFALQAVIFREFRRIASAGWTIVLTAAVFSVLHLPNPFLAPLTFAGGILWCWIYSRHPNVLPLALSHSLCSLMILATLPKSLTGSLRVGYAYMLL